MLEYPVWVNDHYYIIKSGQFGYGWDLYQKGGRIVAFSGAYCKSPEEARDQAIGAIPQTAT